MSHFLIQVRRAAERLGSLSVWRLAALTAVIFGAGASVVFAAGPSGTQAEAQQQQSSPASAFAASPTHGWVGTWESAQVEAGTTGLSATGFTNQTVRDIVHTSVGGSEIRLRLSNVFGTAPLQVSAVYVGLRSSGAAIEAGTNTEVTFDGSDQVTIPKGERVVSDPVKLRVGNEQDLAVSIYFAAPTGPTTWHPEAVSTNYYASGNAAADTSASAYTNTDTSWYFLDGVDVLNPSVKGAVVAFGPSTTDGNASTPDANVRYPDDLARRLLALPAGERMSVLNAGISGNQLLSNTATDGPAGVARFLRDAVEQTGVKDVIIWEGTNDIAADQNLSASQITDAYQELIDVAHTYGIKVIGATLQPVEGNGDFSVTGNATREQINNWIRTSGAFDGAADFSTVLENPANPDAMLPAYDSGDHLHPNDAGYQAIADSFNLEELTSPRGTRVFSGIATPSPLSITLGTQKSYTETVTIQSQSDRAYTLPWTVTAPAGSGIKLEPASGRITIPADGSAKVSFTVQSGSTEGSFPLEFDLHDRNGESALASHFTVVAETPGDLSPLYNNTGISDDGAVDQANLDGGGYSYSEQLLTAAGLAPGASVTAGGLDFTWPNVAAGQPDNVEADGQTIVPDLPAGSSELGFLGVGTNSGTYGSQGPVTINYTDGTSTTEELGFGGYALGFATNPAIPFGDTVVADLAYENYESGTPRQDPMYLFEQTLPIDPSKTVANIVLPESGQVPHGQIHVFALSEPASGS